MGCRLAANRGASRTLRVFGRRRLPRHDTASNASKAKLVSNQRVKAADRVGCLDARTGFYELENRAELDQVLCGVTQTNDREDGVRFLPWNGNRAEES